MAFVVENSELISNIGWILKFYWRIQPTIEVSYNGINSILIIQFNGPYFTHDIQVNLEYSLTLLMFSLEISFAVDWFIISQRLQQKHGKPWTQTEDRIKCVRLVHCMHANAVHSLTLITRIHNNRIKWTNFSAWLQMQQQDLWHNSAAMKVHFVKSELQIQSKCPASITTMK